MGMDLLAREECWPPALSSPMDKEKKVFSFVRQSISATKKSSKALQRSKSGLEVEVSHLGRTDSQDNEISASFFVVQEEFCFVYNWW